MPIGIPPVIQGPSRQHHLVCEIAVIDHAPAHMPAVSIIRENTALHLFPADQGFQVLPGALAAGIIPSLRLAELLQLRSINTEQAHSFATDCQRIAVDDLDRRGVASRPGLIGDEQPGSNQADRKDKPHDPEPVSSCRE